jgi:hypothetical protein
MNRLAKSQVQLKYQSGAIERQTSVGTVARAAAAAGAANIGARAALVRH